MVTGLKVRLGPNWRRRAERVAPARPMSPAIEFFKGQQTESSNHMQTFALNALAEQFECDRSTMVRALRGVPPDLVKRGNRPQWKVATAAKALEAHRRKQGGSDAGNNRDPEVERLSTEFEGKLAALRKLPALEDRRAAARALAPLIDEVGRASRAVGRRNGNGEMADIITDQMMMLMTRGFCEPCDWTGDEAFSAGMMPDDEDA